MVLSGKAQVDTTGANVQPWHCGIDSAFYRNASIFDDSFYSDMAAYNDSILSKTNNTSSTKSYTIPVVFHIISTNPSSITYAQIKWQVAALNAAYQNQMLQFRGTSSGPEAVNTNIEFVLACIPMPTSGTNTATITGLAGWSNAAEPGVVRYMTSNSNVLNQGVLSASTYTPMLAMTNPTGYFPKADYLNIYCVPNIVSPTGGTVIGFGTFPWMNIALDGITMRIDCIGNNSYPTDFPLMSQLDKGTVLAHEVGHYLGLYHTFESIVGGNPNTAGGVTGCYGLTGTLTNTTTSAYTDGDMIFDTPPTEITSDLGSIPIINTCHENYEPYQTYTAVTNYTLLDQNDQLENYMCYSDDDKLNTFTTLQAKRMWGSLDATYGTAIRANLTSSTNLAATGVSTWPTSCAAYSGIVTGIFNYAIAQGSSCAAVKMQFTNPTSFGFSASSTTTYSWTFGDGTTTTTTVSPIVHTYTNQSSYTVTCTATNGTLTNTYSTTISANFNVSIIGQSSQMGSNTSSTVCKGMEQTIFVKFGVGVPSAILTDGTNNYQVNNYMDLTLVDTVPYLFVANASASYSISPAACNGISNGVASFNVINCCPSLITNGDFESGNTGFVSDLYYGSLSAGIYGDYAINPLTIPSYNGLTTQTQHGTGNAMLVDGFAGNNGIVSIPQACAKSPSPAPRVWQQTISGLQPNANYIYSFKILENYKNADCSGTLAGLNFQTSIASASLTPLPPQKFAPTVDKLVPIPPPTYTVDFVVYTYTFTTPPSTSPSTNFSVTINQINNFQGSYFDYFLDNITLNQLTSGIQALGSATVCPSATVQLTAQSNCPNTSYNYSWLPATGLSCTTCSNPIASPSSTTVYTLVAAPVTNTLGIYPTYVTTATVTISNTPVISVSGNTAICPGISSTTLTATGANTYTWQPGNSNSNPFAITPTVSTTYTVSGKATGCTATGTNTVLVTVNTTNTTLTVTPASPTLCSNYTAVNLTASGASTYTWMPAATLSSNSSSSVVASPPASTTYTVMGTNNGCVGTKTLAIAVAIAPTLTLNTSGSFVCPNTSATLTASGSATNYSWTPATGLSSTSGSTVIALINGTIGYSVSVSANGCTATASVYEGNLSISSITASATNTLVCEGNTTTLTASGSYGYSWTPSSGLNSSTGSPVVATPTANTTYTVTGISSYTGGCPVTNTIYVNVLTNFCSGNQPSYNITSSGTFNPSTGFIAQNMYIKSPASYTINCANLSIASNAQINVASGATLVITGSWLHACYSCNNIMWDGINVANGGKLIVENYSIIEDADTAVYTASQLSGSAAAIWNISSSIFNKNGINLYADVNEGGNYASSYVYNTIFTCRSLSSHTTNSATIFNGIKSNILAATPLIPSTTNPTTVTLAGTRTQYGISLNSISPTATVSIGNSAQSSNLFDNMDYGLSASATPIAVKNNVFQNLTGSDCRCYGSPTTGIGVWSGGAGWEGGNSNTIIGNNSATINNAEKNYFSNCLLGVVLYNCGYAMVNNNTFTNETTATTFTVPGSYVTGEYAVNNSGFAISSSTLNPTEQLQFCNNSVSNYATGYFLDFGKLFNLNAGSTGGSGYLFNNTITASGTNYCNYGIYLQQSNTFGAASGVPITAIEITTNTITNVNTNCIYAQNIGNSSSTAGFVDIQTNSELSVKANAFTSNPMPRVAAISLSNCWYVRACDNSYIHTAGYTGTSVPTGQFMAGIYVNQSPRSDVDCNTITNMGECFVWESTSPSYTVNSSRWQRNNLDYSKYGLVLRNSGVMGDQGSTSYPINTTWGTSTHFTGAQTLSDLSAPGTGATSKLYEATTNCTTTPCTNTYTPGSLGYYVAGTTLLRGSGTNTMHCVSDVGGGGGGGGRLENGSQTVDATNPDSLNNAMLAILQSKGTLPVYDYETRWALHHHIHSMYPNLVIPALDHAKNFAEADAAIASGNYGIAKALLNAITPANALEQNWMNVDNILLRVNQTTLTATDIASLQQVANQCHLTGGSIVWRARALLNHYYGNILTFTDNCLAVTSTTNRDANTTGIESLSSNQSVNFYPNPNNGKMVFEYTLLSNAQLRISDVSGREIGLYTLNASENSIEINNESLINGVYLYTVINEQGLVKTGRIVIMK